MEEPHPSSPLLSLPRELRDLILGFALPSQIQWTPRGSPKSLEFISVNGILFTTSQLRIEALCALRRQLPITTFVAPLSTPFPPNSPRDFPNLLIHIENIKIQVLAQRAARLLVPPKPVSGWFTILLLEAMLVMMPALKVVTFEIDLLPKPTVPVQEPRATRNILRDLRLAIQDQIVWEGWIMRVLTGEQYKGEKMWGGVVVLRRPGTGAGELESGEETVGMSRWLAMRAERVSAA